MGQLTPLDDEDLALCRETFLPESQDLLERILTAFLNLEEAGGEAPAAVSEALGALHTLKGASAVARFPGVRHMAHALEEALQASEVTAELRGFLFVGLDFMTNTILSAYGLGRAPEGTLVDVFAECPVELPSQLLVAARDLALAGDGEGGDGRVGDGTAAQGGASTPTQAPTPAPSASPTPEPHEEPSERSEPPAEAERRDGYSRVRHGVVDDLLQELGELLISLGSLEEVQSLLASREDTRALGARLGRDLGWIRRQFSSCHESARRLRMVGVGTLLPALRRAAQDVASREAKRVAVAIEGEEPDLDRKLVETLRGLLLHLVRNAAGHGIESPEVRREAGKPEAGQVTVRFRVVAASVHVDVWDDGAGVEVQSLVARAIQAGVRSAADVELLDEAERLALVFEEGLSTQESVSEISGRGVGLAEVRQRVLQLGGQLDVSSEPGQGTRFSMRIPLATTTLSVLLVRARRQTLLVPMGAVAQVLTHRDAEETSLVDAPCLEWGDQRVGCRDLGAMLELPGPPTETPAYVVLGSGGARLALRVDEVLEQRELVFRPLGRRFARFDLYAGATILSSGQVGLILNPAALLDRMGVARKLGGASLGAPSESSERTILVVDDSVTMLTMLSSLLEAAGYRIVQARDGVEALEKAQGFALDLVLTDVDMPRMDGFSLTRALKSQTRTARTPVIVLTSNDDQRSRTLGMEAGADAYLVKGCIDRPTLEQTVDRYLH